MRRILALITATWLVVGTTLSGCGPNLSDEDLGQLQTKESELPGAGEEYELPESEFPMDDREFSADNP